MTPTMNVEVSARFPLGLGNFSALVSAERPSAEGLRPFGLRFGQQRPAPVRGDTLDQARYDHDLQVAVGPDGSPLVMAGTGSMETTGASTDGQGSTGGEEWTPDYAGDM